MKILPFTVPHQITAGKTTIARCMGRMFNMLGLLPDDHVVECTPKDLTTGYAGQAAIKTTEILEQSRGSVLFIDEAYQLNPERGGAYMNEVVDELCAKLTDVEFKGKLLVLLAGYDADMDKMLAVNPGLKSRFAERIAFQDLSEEATRDLIVLKLEKKKIALVPEDAESNELLALAGKLVNSSDFANGRDVETVCDRTYAELAKRPGSSRKKVVSLDDVRNAINSLVISRKPQVNSRSCINIDLKDQACSTSTSMKALPITALAVEEVIENEEEKEEEKKEVEENTTEEETNSFDNLNTGHLKGLQDVVEEMGLNTSNGIEKLVSSNDSDNNLFQRLMENLDISMDVAQTFVMEWRKAHKEANRLKMKNKNKFKGMEAIWHCAVCGRGGHTSPVCYVAPYISSYRAAPI